MTKNIDLSEEVEALSAIYGDGNVLFNPERSANLAMISISLDSLCGRVTLSAQMERDYPKTHPQPKLRSESISAAECGHIVKTMMIRQQSSAGEVCLFEYCQTLLSVLSEEKQSNAELIPTSEEPPKRETEKYFTVLHGEPLTDRKSVFQAHIAHITCAQDASLVLEQLCLSKKVENATHNTIAWRVDGTECFDDDGEKGAGKVVLHVLRHLDAKNTVCIVSRWFGGTKLGPVRFRHIGSVTRDIVKANDELVKSWAARRSENGKSSTDGS